MTRLLFLILLIFGEMAHAGRPLITDDAGVTGKGIFQLESWIFADERFFQHWVVPTVGVHERVEVTASAVHGVPFLDDRSYSTSGPILQIKAMMTEGFAISGGSLAPWGRGIFKTGDWDHFIYGALTLSPENFLVHLNLGLQREVVLWGTAIEWRAREKTHYFLEGSNGDVYATIPGVALQTGLRHDLSDTLQLDGTLGRGLTGDPILPLWITLGIKWIYEL